jgi:hypothetical protein
LENHSPHTKRESSKPMTDSDPNGNLF